jgi:Ca2+-binding RTX toxin-like protein
MASVNDEGDIDDSVPTGNPMIDGLLTEYHWSHLARANFQFTIPDSETDYEDTRDLLVDDYPDDNHIGVQAMAAWMVAGVRDAIAEFNNILNFQITEQADNNVDTQLRYAVADLTHDGDQPPPPAYAWTPQDDGVTSEQDNWKSGDMFYNKNRFTMQDQPGTELVGTYQYHTILHETGHALGLKHGHEADHDNPALPSQWDSMEFTVMTYRSYVGAPTGGGYPTAWGNFAQTLMMLDIQALQYIYGADFTTQSGNTVYKWDGTGKYSINGVDQWTTVTAVIFLTIWDGGGVDTYDFSAFSTAETINLGAGKWSNLGTQLADLDGAGGSRTARGNVFNALQYNNVTTDARSLIENAIGGSAGDRIDGNFVGNRLDGRNGDDLIYGVDGNDTLIGGAGADLLNGGAGFDTAEYSAAGGETIVIRPLTTDPTLGRWSITGAAQASGDILAQLEAFRFGEGADNISTAGTTAAFSFNLDGRGGNDTISGGAGADTLTGGLGTDRLLPNQGVYTVFGGALGSTGAWNESLAQNDVLVLDRSGDPDGNTVNFNSSVGAVGQFSEAGGSTARGISRLEYAGGVGVDYVSGGLGNDTLEGAGGDDYLFGGLGSDTIRGGAGFDRMYGGEGHDRIETGGGADSVVNGENGNDTLVGSNDAEWFSGGANNDLVQALGGADHLYGELGNDTLFAGLGNDTVDPGLGVENLDGGAGDFDYLNINRGATTLGVSFYLNGADGSDGTRALNFETVTYNAGSGNDTIRGWSNADNLTGNDGKDVLEGVAGDDYLFGGAGSDTIRGGAGFDRMYGGNDGDRIETGGGADSVVNGENGNDTLVGSNDAEWFSGGADNDLVQALGGADHLYGELGNDTLFAGLGNDTVDPGLGVENLDGGEGDFDYLNINRGSTALGVSFYLNGAAGSDGTKALNFETLTYNAGSGNDTIRGWNNADNLTGNDGNDVLEGMAGDDYLYGGAGSDTLRGGTGFDRMYGGNDGDRIETGGGADSAVNGENGNDTLVGSNDAEWFSGGADNDLIQALGGADHLYGELGNDTLFAGLGNDTVDPGLGVENLDGGAGDFDYLNINRGSTALGVSFYLNGAVGSDGTKAVNFETVTYNAGSGNDTIRGWNNADNLTGNDGNDILEGMAGDDYLFGGAGSDTLRGGTGFDRMYGGNDGDRIETGGGADSVVNGENGNDTLVGSNDAEWLSGGADNDLIQALGGADHLYGELGNDTLFAGLGNDTVDPGLGVENLDGGAGDFDYLNINRGSTALGVSFYLNGAVGSDGTKALNFETVTYNAGSGNDTVRGWNNADNLTGNDGNDVLEGMGGDDNLFGGGGSDTLRGGAGFDRMYGGNDGDRIETGGGADSVVNGENGNDTLVGSNDAEWFSGGADNDLVQALGGADHLYGDAGADTLRGGLGNDTFDGGEGADILVFDQGVGNDYVIGFDSDAAGGQDLLNVGSFGFASYAAMLASGVTILQSGSNTVIDFGSGDPIVTLANILRTTINSTDFIF